MLHNFFSTNYLILTLECSKQGSGKIDLFKNTAHKMKKTLFTSKSFQEKIADQKWAETFLQYSVSTKIQHNKFTIMISNRVSTKAS